MDDSESLHDWILRNAVDDSYPNIGQAFRGYDLVKSEPLGFGVDPGYRGHIFDEGHERRPDVRFR